MPDTSDLDPAYVTHVRETLFPQIADSVAFISICPSDGVPDVKFCLELGASIMYDKSIILITMRGGAPIPPRLGRLADVVLEEMDLEDAEDQARMERAIRAVVQEWS